MRAWAPQLTGVAETGSVLVSPPTGAQAPSSPSKPPLSTAAIVGIVVSTVCASFLACGCALAAVAFTCRRPFVAPSFLSDDGSSRGARFIKGGSSRQHTPPAFIGADVEVDVESAAGGAQFGTGARKNRTSAGLPDRAALFRNTLATRTPRRALLFQFHLGFDDGSSSPVVSPGFGGGGGGHKLPDSPRRSSRLGRRRSASPPQRAFTTRQHELAEGLGGTQVAQLRTHGVTLERAASSPASSECVAAAVLRVAAVSERARADSIMAVASKV